MSTLPPIVIPDLYLRIGQKTECPNSDEFRGLTPPSLFPENSPCGIIISWGSPAREYLKVDASVLNSEDQVTGGFHSSIDESTSFDPRVELIKLLDLFHRDRESILEAMKGCSFIFGELPANSHLDLELRFDTDSLVLENLVDRYCAELDLDPEDICDNEQFLNRVQADHALTVFWFNKEINFEDKLALQLSPLTLPPFYEGFVSLDFGNTASALVALEAGTFNQFRPAQNDDLVSERIKLLPDLPRSEASLGRLQLEAPPTPTDVRIDARAGLEDVSGANLTEKQENMATAWRFPLGYQWMVGREAQLIQGTQGFVLGAKRRSASRRSLSPGHAKPLRLRIFPSLVYQSQVANREWTDLDQQLPGELFICRLLQNFRSATKRIPDQLVFAYPTTYTLRELRQLQETIRHAWQRMMMEDSSDSMPESDQQTIFPFSIDEATAAAYFFLYRKVFEKPGGLARFHSVYPDGYTMLLYDCGGGTTDIAIVNGTASLKQSAERSPENPDEETTEVGGELNVQVLGRSGLRMFGGDNITQEVFRLLKAKLAHKLFEAKLKNSTSKDFPKLPSQRGTDLQTLCDAWESVFQAHAWEIDHLVPTRFDDEAISEFRLKPKQIETRQRLTLRLWKLAEELKKILSTQEKAQLAGEKNSISPVLDEFARQESSWLDLLGIPAKKDVQVDSNTKVTIILANLEIERREVDALIEEAVQHSVKACNVLVEKIVAEKGCRVDDVHVVGNATRYPLLRELLQSHLQIPFLSDSEYLSQQRFHFDPNHLKHAVARGVALAWWSISSHLGRAKVNFPKDLKKYLPFTVAYPDALTGTPETLFEEGDAYHTLKKKRIKLPDPSYDDRLPGNRSITILRQFPGEEKPQDWLTFRFEQPIEGEVEIFFDTTIEVEDFVVQDEGIQQAVLIRDHSDVVFDPPAQRGDL